MNNIFTNSEYINQLKEEIEEGLILAGLPQEEIDKNLEALDLFILGRVSENVSEDLTDDQKSELKKLVDNGKANKEELVATLGISEEQMVELYIRELEDYLAELTKNVPNLKKEQSTTGQPVVGA